MGMTGGTERRRDRRRREQQERQATQNHDVVPKREPTDDVNLSARRNNTPGGNALPDGHQIDPDLNYMQAPSDYAALAAEQPDQAQTPASHHGLQPHSEPWGTPAAHQAATVDQPVSNRRSIVDTVKTWTGAQRVVPATWADGNQPPPGAVAPGVEPQPRQDIVDPMYHSSHRLTTDETLQVAQARNPLDDTVTDQPVSYREQADAPFTDDTADVPESIDLRPFDDQSYGYFETEPSESLQAALDEERQALNASYHHSDTNSSDLPDLDPSNTAWPQAPNEADVDNRYTSAPYAGASPTITDDNGQLVPPVAEITHADDRRIHAEASDSDAGPAKKRPWWFYGLWAIAAAAAVIGWLKPGLGYNWIQGLSGNTVSTVSCKEAAPTASVELVVSQWKHKQIPVELVSVCDGKALLSINPVTQAQADQADQLLRAEGRQEKSGYWLYGVPVQVRSAP